MNNVDILLIGETKLDSSFPDAQLKAIIKATSIRSFCVKRRAFSFYEITLANKAVKNSNGYTNYNL